MPIALARLLAGFATGYALAGAVFAILFVSRGTCRLDPRAGGGSLPFRLALLPGAVALWPWLAWRWLRGEPASAGAED